MVIERKGGRTFSLRVLLRANFVFLFSNFSSVLSSQRTLPLSCSFSLPFSCPQWFCLVTVCFCMGDLNTGRMRFLEEQILKVVSAACLGLF